MPTRRALLKAAVLAGAGLVVGRQQSQAVARESTATEPDSADRWPATDIFHGWRRAIFHATGGISALLIPWKKGEPAIAARDIK